MPKPTESYVRNMVIRFILTDAGKQLSYEEFSKEKHWKTILHDFDKKCCYCHTDKRLEADHIVGMNMLELGFDCLGNVAPACRSCNQRKNNLGEKMTEIERYGWDIHLEKACNNKQEYKQRKHKIQDYMKRHKYPPFDMGSDLYKQFKERIDSISGEAQRFLSTNKESFQTFLERLTIKK